jgi:lipopolysaccharide export LptBFGC system permease protein LptF
MTPPRIKAGKASLIGGIVVGLASFVLWTAIARDLGAGTVPWLAAGFLVSAAIGVWIRKADL